MSSVITSALRASIAQGMYDEIVSRRATYYTFLGQTLSWLNQDEPMVPRDDLKYENQVRNNMISLKQITESDICLIVPRIDWVKDTVYDMYDDSYSVDNPAYSGATNIKNAKFYVLNSEFNVYKCISNNGDAPSTVSPIDVGVDLIHTSDGYIWKYMFNVPSALRNKFLTSAFMPVMTALKDKFYTSGTIDKIKILNPGSGYTTVPDIVVVGDGTSSTGIANTKAKLTAVMENGQVTNVIINDAGLGYSFANLELVTDEAHRPTVPAKIQADLSVGTLNTIQSNVELQAVNGSIDFIKMISNGTGYGAATVSITGDGEGATATAVIQNGQIKGINILNHGSNYTYANVEITGNGTGATARVIISPPGGHGKNVEKELYASAVMTYTSISVEKNKGFTVNNDYRQFGIIRNPQKYVSTDRLISSLASACFKITAQFDPELYENDMILTDSSGHKYLIIAFNTSTMLLQPLDNHPCIVNQILNMQINENTYSFKIIDVESPDFNKFSGDILYIDNRKAFSPSLEETIVTRTAIQF
ncbi:MAG: hypothetical protein EBU90_19845 [Proteobacteria bacterium]|nr:hypothetical protein [Pseudomonadota bacterium]